MWRSQAPSACPTTTRPGCRWGQRATAGHGVEEPGRPSGRDGFRDRPIPSARRRTAGRARGRRVRRRGSPGDVLGGSGRRVGAGSSHSSSRIRSGSISARARERGRRSGRRRGARMGSRPSAPGTGSQGGTSAQAQGIPVAWRATSSAKTAQRGRASTRPHRRGGRSAPRPRIASRRPKSRIRPACPTLPHGEGGRSAAMAGRPNMHGPHWPADPPPGTAGRGRFQRARTPAGGSTMSAATPPGRRRRRPQSSGVKGTRRAAGRGSQRPAEPTDERPPGGAWRAHPPGRARRPAACRTRSRTCPGATTAPPRVTRVLPGDRAVPQSAVPRRPVPGDQRQMGEGLDVVDQGRAGRATPRCARRGGCR